MNDLQRQYLDYENDVACERYAQTPEAQRLGLLAIASGITTIVLLFGFIYRMISTSSFPNPLPLLFSIGVFALLIWFLGRGARAEQYRLRKEWRARFVRVYPSAERPEDV